MSLFSRLSARWSNTPRELKLFVTATLVVGLAYSMYDSTFNNFLNEKFALTGFQRSFLEFPRELPGVLTAFVAALFSFLASRRLGVLAMLMGLAGILLIGFASSSYALMVVWLFIYSMGQHLYMPVAQMIGMELAREGKFGQRLGQLNAIRNLAAILGSFFIVLGFRYLGLSFKLTFVLGAVGLLATATLLFSMKSEKPQTTRLFLKLHPQYRLYYMLAILAGTRKQIFITFAPWVLVTIFNQSTQIMATLFTIGGIIGVLFQPFLGWAIDRFGEKVVLASEAVMLVFVCFGYGFAKNLFSAGLAFLVTCGCYLLDQMLFSVSMARSTYIKKIATDPAHVQPALTASVTIDHVFSIPMALLGGVIWNSVGYQYVFLVGALIAMINFIVVQQMHIPKHEAGQVVAAIGD